MLVVTTKARLALAALLLLPFAGHTQAVGRDYLSRPEVRAFIEAMEAEYGFDPAVLEEALGTARYQPTVARLIGPERPTPAVRPVRSYPRYRAKFVTPSRIAAGTQYWDANEVWLRRAEAEYGVPAEVILGILGVETAFGRNTGSFRVLDALTTIAFDGPRRQDYFREELKELFLLSRDYGIDPLALKGSYAGAVGLPQFMPSSYRRHAVDFDQDGMVDLLGTPADAIGSIASYLKAHGWVPGQKSRVSVRLPTGRESEMVSGLERAHHVADLRKQGVQFATSAVPDDYCSIVEVPTPGKPARYLAGFANFEAITRYNRSTFYAMAVLDLAEAIYAARIQQVTARAEEDDPPSG